MEPDPEPEPNSNIMAQFILITVLTLIRDCL